MLEKEMQPVREAFALGQDLDGTYDGTSWTGRGELLRSISPIDGSVLATLRTTTAEEYQNVLTAASAAQVVWREVPAPKRGEVVRQLGETLRKHKDLLGRLVTLEMGKSLQEGLGEVQEMIDIMDMACGQSRMLYGVQTHSERQRHRMFEQWHPLGNVGIITAFNFPVAVWAWNTSLALICGDSCVWKPSSETPLCAIACTRLISKVLSDNGYPTALATLVTGKGSTVGNWMLEDSRLPLISYTGSVPIGRVVGEKVTHRLGRTILELGGNNAVIVTAAANLELAARSILFGAVGTAGQRCTSTRRVILHKDIYDRFVELLSDYYRRVTIGNPLDRANFLGPMVSKRAVADYLAALRTVTEQGGKVLWGGEQLDKAGGCWVTPAVAAVRHDLPLVAEETFAPLLYLIRYEGDIRQAIAYNNEVPQGLSSSVFTNDLREAEAFLSATGSDCGIANVNTGTSGAEIGLAFGGEKETGGGRESGSDVWKCYMRRQSNTVNWSDRLELAQGISFD